uniref:Fibronectin n=1 Tax=Phallusia mammillata TaxID=59560 RepID=A0A6F9DDU6_9ASCI|nr:fibronectin [Phallusia mammillata]
MDKNNTSDDNINVENILKKAGQELVVDITDPGTNTEVAEISWKKLVSSNSDNARQTQTVQPINEQTQLLPTALNNTSNGDKNVLDEAGQQRDVAVIRPGTAIKKAGKSPKNSQNNEQNPLLRTDTNNGNMNGDKNVLDKAGQEPGAFVTEPGTEEAGTSQKQLASSNSETSKQTKTTQQSSSENNEQTPLLPVAINDTSDGDTSVNAEDSNDGCKCCCLCN